MICDEDVPRGADYTVKSVEELESVLRDLLERLETSVIVARIKKIR